MNMKYAMRSEDTEQINVVSWANWNANHYPELVCILTLARCGKSDSGDYPATIMVNGTNYYSTDHAVPVEVDESVIQYTTSYAENGIPQKDGEANFNRDLGTPYAVIEDDRVVVLIDNEWIEFKAK